MAYELKASSCDPLRKKQQQQQQQQQQQKKTKILACKFTL